MKHATLLFLLEDDRILLAMKKRGFGMGRWNGVGGKVEQTETVEEAAARECYEEIGVLPQDIEKVAHLSFQYAGETPDFFTHVFVARRWKGEPAESEEMSPKWFTVEGIPYPEMWPDDEHWLPRIMSGEKIIAHFKFDEGQKMLQEEMHIEEVSELPGDT